MTTRGRGFAVALFLSLLVFLGNAPGGRAESVDPARFSLTPFAGRTFFDREYETARAGGLADGIDLGGRAGVRIVSALWLEGAGGVTTTHTGAHRDQHWLHASVDFLLMPAPSHAIVPFLAVGAGVSEFRPAFGAAVRDGTWDAAGGVVIRITNAIGLRLEARNTLLLPAHDLGKAHLDDVTAGAGLTLAFGGHGRDTDEDGIPDRRDRCPDTPSECRVDAAGCPVDTDHDGVCDALDRCPGTPPGSRVDSHGCPQDRDGDGIPDGIDQCPDSPRGCPVDARGCSTDSDGDGVCDGLDRCPATPAGCSVDPRGCPLDTDGDGVCDGNDKCPNTPAGAKVDAEGCPLANAPDPEVDKRESELLDTGKIRMQEIEFESGKATILTTSFAKLDAVGKVLSKWTQLRIEIGGHCDARGSEAANLDLSQRRAEAVRAYLLQHFDRLAPDHLVAHGYGEAQPLVPNTTPSNMARNRRVEFRVLNKDVLRDIKR